MMNRAAEGEHGMIASGAIEISEQAFQGRMQAAVRAGSPRWIWPEIPQAEWRLALADIERTTRSILLADTAGIEVRNVHAFSVACLTSGMGPLLGYWASRGQLRADEATRELLDLHYQHNSARMRRLADSATAAVAELARASIQVTVLKGMQTAFDCFPTPGTRPLSDIDLLIDPRDGERAAEVLQRLGYEPGRKLPLPPQQCWRHQHSSAAPRSALLLHRDNPWYIDLQTSLSRRYSHGAPMIDLDPLLALVPVPWVLSPRGRALPPAAMVLHLACHASCGLENLMMIRLVELVLQVRTARAAGAFSWTELVELAERTGTLSSAFPALYLAEDLCAGTVPGAVLERAEREAPRPVSRVVRRLSPASAQRVVRCSIEERLMWSNSLGRVMRDIALSLFPRHLPLRELAEIYRMRVWIVLRRAISKSVAEGF
jgi:hypothetical protein